MKLTVYVAIYISSSTLVIKTLLCLRFDQNKFAIHATCITTYWLNQAINFYSEKQR